MKRLLLVAAILFCASAAQAGPFTVYDGYNFYYGNTAPYGGQIVNGYTGRAIYWQGNFQPAIGFPSYNYNTYYNAPVYYNQPRYWYGYRGW